MAISDYMISGVPSDAQSSNFTLNGMGNRAQPDIPGLSADEMKEVMDELVTKVMAAAFNAALVEINASFSLLAPFISTPRNVVSDVDAAGTLNSDIPNVEAVKDAINDAVIAAGAADMTKAVYDTNDDGIVDHAALADTATAATSATTAATATDSNALGGQGPSYYATASALTTASGKITTLEGLVGNGSSTTDSLVSRMDNLTNDNALRAIRKVTSLPSNANANTIYLVTG